MKRWLYTLLSAMVGVVAPLFAPVVTTAAVDRISQTFQTASVYDDGLLRVVSDNALTDSEASAKPIPFFGQVVGLVAAKTPLSNSQLIQSVATRAANAIGGSGRFAGTSKHAYTDELLTRYQNIYGQRGLITESTWLNGVAKPYGTKGAVRLMKSWPSSIASLQRVGGVNAWSEKCQSWLTNPVTVRKTVEEQIAFHRVEHLPNVELSV